MSTSKELNRNMRDKLARLQSEEALPEPLRRALDIIADHLDEFPPFEETPLAAVNFVYFH